MAESYLALGVSEQREILNTVASESGRQAAVLEKDVWVCWVLQTLFSIPNRHPMAFKGGTSLSKVYGVINRFSEDVDVTLDYRGFGAGFDPFVPGLSNSQIRKFSDRLKTCVRSYAHEVVVPAIDAAAMSLVTRGQHPIRIDDTGEKIRFGYPSAVEDPDGYLASEVLLELGGRNVIDPNERHGVGPDIAAYTPGIDYPVAEVTVLSPMRTFWEKATLIHVECNRGRLTDSPQRLSRHWFDLMCLAENRIGRTAMSNRPLLEDVVRHKKIFFRARYANYDDCLVGGLTLVPGDEGLRGLEIDYREMRMAGMLGHQAPDFGTLIERTRGIEAAVNVWS